MSADKKRAVSHRRRGFTMVELLIVIVIIGVMAAVIGPTFTVGSAIARTKTASRGVIQMSRYARTMALLHQTPVDLVYMSDGTLRVEQAGSGGESIVSAKAFASTNAADTGEASEPEEVSVGAPKKADVEQEGGASYVMADLNIEKKFEGTVFVFKGYADSMDDGRSRKVGRAVEVRPDADVEEESEGEGEVKAFRVRYKSNGTCRPYGVQVTSGGEETFALTVNIDVLGSAKVEEEDD